MHVTADIPEEYEFPAGERGGFASENEKDPVVSPYLGDQGSGERLAIVDDREGRKVLVESNQVEVARGRSTMI